MAHKTSVFFLVLCLCCILPNLHAEEIGRNATVASPRNNSPAPAGIDPVAVQKIVFETSALLVRTNGKVNSFSSFRLSKPARLVIDLPNVINQLDSQAFTGDTAPVSSVRAVAYSDKLRLIIEASATPAFPDTRIESTPAGLVINILESAAPAVLSPAPPQTAPDREVKVELSQLKPSTAGAVTSRGHVASVAVEQKQDTARVTLNISGNCQISDPVEVLNGISVSLGDCIVPANWQDSVDAVKENSAVKAVTLFTFDKTRKVEAGMLIELRQKSKFGYSKDKQRLVIDLTGAARAALTEDAPPFKLSASRKDAKAGAKTFTGKRVSMEFDNADLRQIFRLLGEVSGDNIIIGDDVKGNYTIKFKEVPWDQALEMILINNNLEVTQYGNVIEIVTYDKIKRRRDQMLERQKQLFEQKLADEKMNAIGRSVDNKADEIVTARCQVNNTTVVDILPVLNILLSKFRSVLGSNALINTTKTNANVTPQTGGLFGGGGFSGDATFDKTTSIQQQSTYKSEYGEMYPESNTNTIIINDRKDVIRKAESIISILDVPKKQVLIEARMIEASTTFTRDLGVQWGVHYRDGSASLFGINSLDTGFGGVVSQPPISGSSGPGLSTGISFGTLASNIKLDARLSAAASLGTIKIISSPKVVTTYGYPAKITQGQQIPYTSTTGDKVETKFILAALVLDVTPRITPAGGVLMDLKISNDSSTGVGNPPSINKKETTTQMTIQDNETAVIGGIYTNSDTDFEQGVPFLMDIPYLGKLFKSNNATKTQTEMLIFLTPRLLDKEKQNVTTRTKCLIVE
ncbi:MAG: type IV pilus secretin PilQ [Deltaproteobacteria bacterium]|nr:type IV pilus secretin PilQ [Deltaproteobacteria bacterium]